MFNLNFRIYDQERTRKIIIEGNTNNCNNNNNYGSINGDNHGYIEKVTSGN